MDEVHGHGGRRADELVKPVNESGERGDPDDTERGLRTGGHWLDATPPGTEEQEPASGFLNAMRDQQAVSHRDHGRNPPRVGLNTPRQLPHPAGRGARVAALEDAP